jgi:PHD/YefM family antitoxin component YafN of YafNO toxin-antitoxin module
MGAIDDKLSQGPVHVIRRNKPTYVILKEDDYQRMLEDLAAARVEAAEAEVAAGRVKRGTARKLIAELGK